MVQSALPIIAGLLFGWGRARILATNAKAIEAPAANPVARAYMVSSLCFFLAFAALLLTASLIDTLGGNRPLSEAVGFSGLACFVVCMGCLLRFAAVNKARQAAQTRSNQQEARVGSTSIIPNTLHWKVWMPWGSMVALAFVTTIPVRRHFSETAGYLLWLAIVFWFAVAYERGKMGHRGKTNLRSKSRANVAHVSMWDRDIDG